MKAWMGLMLAGLATVGVAQAAKIPEQDPHALRREYEEPAPWKEGAVTVPALPAEADLAEVDVAPRNSPFTVQVDTRNLSVGDDGVVRYSVVLSSRSGVRNLFFEGLRCSEGNYTTYAYSSGGGKAFQTMGEPVWRPLPTRGNGAFRRALRDVYFCDKTQRPFTVEQMRERIAQPPRDSHHRNESILYR